MIHQWVDEGEKREVTTGVATCVKSFAVGPTPVLTSAWLLLNVCGMQHRHTHITRTDPLIPGVSLLLNVYITLVLLLLGVL